MTEKAVISAIDNHIATITFNRPDRLNAFNAAMEGELREAMIAAAKDDAVRVIILTGAGRGFCAGADMERLGGIAGSTTTVPRESGKPLGLGGSDRPDFQGRYTYFPAIPKPIIAAINGPAAGLGMVLALYCDMRFAGSDAVFTTAFAKRGLIAEYGINWLLTRLVGPGHALDLLLSARKVGAAEAERIGLVNRTLPQAELLAGARAYAMDLASTVSPRSMRIMKRQIWEAQHQSLAEATAIGEQEMRQSFTSEDFREGVAHFVEKRAARFTGR